MSSKTLDFYFDIVSPASYLAWTQMPRIAAATGANIAYKPILLGGLFKATGNSAPALVPAKGKYLFKDLQRHAQRYQVPYVFNPHFPLNTLEIMRLLAGVQLRQPEQFVAVTDVLYRQMWIEKANLGDAEVVAQALTAAGFPAQELLALAADPAVKEHLKTLTAEAATRGAFGAPTFFVGDEMYFGQDRLDFVEAALKA